MLQASGRVALGSSAGLLLVVTACASARPRPRTLLRLRPASGAVLVVSAPPDLPGRQWRWIPELLPEALARLARFSLALRSPTELRVYADPRAFRRGTGRRARWLRAWAGFDVVHLVPPAFWSDDGRDARVERLAHELCHAAVFQRFGDEEAALRARLPFWLNEGIASVAAGQERRRMPLSLVVERAAGGDPILDVSWIRRDHHVAYGAAHHALALLVERHGDDVAARLLDAARADGAPGSVERALPSICGLRASDLWPALVAQARTKAGTSRRPSKSMPSAWHTAL